MESKRGDVAVVGTGLLGLATAFELVERGLTVTIIGSRRSGNGQASRAAGAMLTVFSEVESKHHPARVAIDIEERLAARRVYDHWLARLEAASDHKLTLTPGLWVIANSNGGDDIDQLRSIAAVAHEHGHDAEMVSPLEVAGLNPQIRAHEALWLPDEGSVNPDHLIQALTAALDINPLCRWVDATALRVQDASGQVTVYTSDEHGFVADHVVLAVGARTSMLLARSPTLGHIDVPPVLSGRGVSLLVRVPFDLPKAVRTPNRGFACGSHMVPRSDGTVYLGATNRLSTEPDLDTAPSLDEIATLIHDGTAELNTRFRDASLIDVRVGHRPVTFDHLPLVGTSAHPSVHFATATYRAGVLLAPRAAQIVADGITDTGTTGGPYSPCRPIRSPSFADVLDSSCESLVDLICQPGGRLPPGSEELLASVLRAGLASISGDNGSTQAAVLSRIWSRAPMEEGIPLVMDAIARVK